MIRIEYDSQVTDEVTGILKSSFAAVNSSYECHSAG